MKFNLLPRRRRHRESNSFSSHAGHARALMKGTVLDSRNCRRRATSDCSFKSSQRHKLWNIEETDTFKSVHYTEKWFFSYLPLLHTSQLCNLNSIIDFLLKLYAHSHSFIVRWKMDYFPSFSSLLRCRWRDSFCWFCIIFHFFNTSIENIFFYFFFVYCSLKINSSIYMEFPHNSLKVYENFFPLWFEYYKKRSY